MTEAEENNNWDCRQPWCEFWRTQIALKEWEQQFIPNHPVILRFYNSKRRCVRTAASRELIYYGNHSSPYFRTQDEYLIAINNSISPEHQYSFIEVFSNEGEFIIRHYIRGGVLSPLWSKEPISENDTLLRERQIASKPYINWSKVVSDTMFGVANKNVTLREFVGKYKF